MAMNFALPKILAIRYGCGMPRWRQQQERETLVGFQIGFSLAGHPRGKIMPHNYGYRLGWHYATLADNGQEMRWQSMQRKRPPGHAGIFATIKLGQSHVIHVRVMDTGQVRSPLWIQRDDPMWGSCTVKRHTIRLKSSCYRKWWVTLRYGSSGKQWVIPRYTVH